MLKIKTNIRKSFQFNLKTWVMCLLKCYTHTYIHMYCQCLINCNYSFISTSITSQLPYDSKSSTPQNIQRSSSYSNSSIFYIWYRPFFRYVLPNLIFLFQCHRRYMTHGEFLNSETCSYSPFPSWSHFYRSFRVLSHLSCKLVFCYTRLSNCFKKVKYNFKLLIKRDNYQMIFFIKTLYDLMLIRTMPLTWLLSVVIIKYCIYKIIF